MSVATLDGDTIVLPGIASAHSHAFQRALRARTQRRRGSFWSWRGAMYELAEKLSPDDLYDLSHFAYVELASAGVTAVGEFHYVHHQAGGAPYERRTELADAVVRAAQDAGLRITLLRVLYHRAGFGDDAAGPQRRFSDKSLDDALSDVQTLMSTYEHDANVGVGIAPHSIRAVPLEWVTEAAAFAKEHELPFHMHVSEQRREIRECLAEHGRRPVALLADHEVLDDRFVAVHATHLDDREIARLGDARAFVCLCRTTERDLGDGQPKSGDLRYAGARLCFGVDSHAVSDPFEEARAAELDERSRTQRRGALAEAEALLVASSREGYAAIGMPGRETEDRVLLDRHAAPVAGAQAELIDDAVVFGATPTCVQRVEVGGRAIVEEGRHIGYDAARTAFESALGRLT